MKLTIPRILIMIAVMTVIVLWAHACRHSDAVNLAKQVQQEMQTGAGPAVRIKCYDGFTCFVITKTGLHELRGKELQILTDSANVGVTVKEIP